MRSFVCTTEAALSELGKRLGSLLPCPAFVALSGGLGAGKTVLTRGIGLSIGAVDISSPTFNIVHEHHADRLLLHFDAYRLQDEDELYAIGYDDYMNMDAIIVMEWAELVKGCLPINRLDINIAGSGSENRLVTMTPHGKQYEEVVEKL